MKRTAPRTRVWGDMLLILVLAESMLDLYHQGYIPIGLAVGAPVLLALCLGMRSSFVTSWLENCLTVATLIVWFGALQIESPDLVPVFAALAVLLLVAYSVVDLRLFGLNLGNPLGILALVFAVLLIVSSCSYIPVEQR